MIEHRIRNGWMLDVASLNPSRSEALHSCSAEMRDFVPPAGEHTAHTCTRKLGVVSKHVLCGVQGRGLPRINGFHPPCGAGGEDRSTICFVHCVGKVSMGMVAHLWKRCRSQRRDLLQCPCCERLTGRRTARQRWKHPRLSRFSSECP